MTEIPLDQIQIGERHRKDLGDIASLAESIREVGLLHPPAVTPDLKLIAGRRRLEAVKELGWQTVTVNVVDIDQLVRGEYAENKFRKDFTPSEAVAIGKAIEELEKPKAKARQEATRAMKGEKVGQRGEGKLPPPRSEQDSSARMASEAGKVARMASEAGKVADKAAKAVGMGRKTYEKAKRVVQAAEERPEEFGEVKEEMDRTGKVDAAYRKVHGTKKAKPKSEPPDSSEDSSNGEPYAYRKTPGKMSLIGYGLDAVCFKASALSKEHLQITLEIVETLLVGAYSEDFMRRLLTLNKNDLKELETWIKAELKRK